MIEVWKDIPDYEELYQVSNYGNIKNKKRNNYLKGGIKRGYREVILFKNNKNNYKLVHRLLAEVFIPNPNNYPVINHIDGNKQNNSLDNLEWCTYSHNNKEACRLKLNKGTAKTTLQFDKNGNFIKEWFSTRVAEKELNITNGKISQCCIGNRKSAGGFVWKYKEEL